MGYQARDHYFGNRPDVCVYIHMCIHTYMHTYVGTYIHTYVQLYIYIYIYLFISSIFVWTTPSQDHTLYLGIQRVLFMPCLLRVHVCMYVYMYMYMYMYMYIYIYIDECMAPRTLWFKVLLVQVELVLQDVS